MKAFFKFYLRKLKTVEMTCKRLWRSPDLYEIFKKYYFYSCWVTQTGIEKSAFHQNVSFHLYDCVVTLRMIYYVIPTYNISPLFITDLKQVVEMVHFIFTTGWESVMVKFALYWISSASLVGSFSPLSLPIAYSTMNSYKYKNGNIVWMGHR